MSPGLGRAAAGARSAIAVVPDPFWSALRSAIEKEVQDCNGVCGTVLWMVDATSDSRLRVSAVADGQDFVEAVFDAETHAVHCRFGRHASRISAALRMDAAAVTAPEAAAIMLSGLSFPEL